MEQAAQIVVDEIESLERRIRAFSQFAAEPPVRPCAVDLNALLEERVAFLKTGHPEVTYECAWMAAIRQRLADQDLVKGILTNLLENAAEAAGRRRHAFWASTAVRQRARGRSKCTIPGPGLSEQVAAISVSAHDFIQEGRHGAGAFHRAQERAADRAATSCW